MVNSNIFASSFSASIMSSVDYTVAVDHNSYFTIIAQNGCAEVILPDLALGPLNTTVNNSRLVLIKNLSTDMINIFPGGTSIFEGGSALYRELTPQSFAFFHGDNSTNQWHSFQPVAGASSGLGLAVRCQPGGALSAQPSGYMAFDVTSGTGMTGLAVSNLDLKGNDISLSLRELGKRGSILHFQFNAGFLTARILSSIDHGSWFEYAISYIDGIQPPGYGELVTIVPTYGNVLQKYTGTLTNLDTNPPTASNENNLTGLTAAWARSATGIYTISMTGMFTSKTFETMSIQGATPHSFSIDATSANVRTVYVRSPTGAVADPIGMKFFFETPD